MILLLLDIRSDFLLYSIKKQKYNLFFDFIRNLIWSY